MRRLGAALFAFLFAFSAIAQVGAPVAGASKNYNAAAPLPVTAGGTGASTARGAASSIGVPYILCKSSVPFIHVSTGSIGNNGALTGVTALPTTYSGGAYVYYPANSIAAGVGAGWYWSVFSSTTAATIFNSTYTSGCPTVGTATAFATTGPGAFTGDTTERAGPTITVPGGAQGLNGSLRVFSFWQTTNNANVKTGRVRIGGAAGTECYAASQASGVGFPVMTQVWNRGAANKQFCYAPTQLTGFGQTAVASAYPAIDTSANHDLVLSLHKATATDNHILEALSIEIVADGT